MTFKNPNPFLLASSRSFQEVLCKLLCSLFLISTLISCSTTDESCPPPLVQADTETIKTIASKAKDHGFLWKVSKDGRSSYLYGTIHLGNLEWIFPGPMVNSAIKESDAIALELDFANPEIIDRLNAAVASLKAYPIPESLENEIKEQAKKECTAYESLAHLTPELQVMNLQFAQGRRDELEVAYGIDIILAGWAQGLQKQVISLETPEMQINLLQSNSEEETVAVVEAGLGMLKSGESRKMIKRMADMWIASDYEDLDQYASWCKCFDTEYDRAMMEKLLDKRNPNLANKIDTLHQTGGKIFAAVGALHMIGPQGLPALMEAKGYKVERVDYSGIQELADANI